MVADVDDKGGGETLSMIAETGGKAMFVRADVTKVAEVEAMVNRAVETYGHLDCAHNNAGIEGATASVIDLEERDWGQSHRYQCEGCVVVLKV